MDRTEALELVGTHLKNKNLVKHSLAVEACMRALALRFGGDPDLWGLTGLLHDLDYEETKDDFPRHGLRTGEILGEAVPAEVRAAIAAHAGHSPRGTPLEKAIYAVDPVTGLIVACALIRPEKKLAPVDTAFVLNRFAEKRFAAGARRDQIETCADLGLTLEQFCDLCLEAMKTASTQLGL